MINFIKKLSFSLLFIATASFAQDVPTQIQNNSGKVYMGLGFGLDYGGMGAKIEYLPVENVGLFAGLGYNLYSAGFNVGASYKINAGERVSFNPTVFYGYNGVLKVEGASEYDMVSYGVTFGINLDIHVGKNGDKITAGLFVPIRSKKFSDNYDDVKNDYRVEMKAELIPIAVGLGYNWKLN